ncbi:MAG: DUF4080 domain-containing protein [Bacteroidales bacterium]
MKFLWLDINASYSHSSLALPALHAQLDNKTLQQTKWKIVSGTLKTNPAQIIAQVQEFAPHYIFATGWLFNIEYLLNILGRIDALKKPSGIFLGGPQFIGNNEQFLRCNPFITAVFKGEGEDMFPQFIQILNREYPDNSWKTIPGFEYIRPTTHNSQTNTPNGSYIESKLQSVLNFKDLTIAEQSPFFNWEKAFVQIETSRGCFNTCRFCVSGIHTAPVQNIPVEELRQRLNTILSHGIKEVRVLDRTFNANPARGIELIALFAEYSGKIQFHIEVHPALLTPSLKEYLKTIPCNLLHVEAGIQSLRDTVIEECRRFGKTSDAIEGLKYLLALKKFEVHADLIAGLPGYTYQALIEDTLEMIQIGPQEIQLELLKLLPGTYFRKNSTQLQINYAPTPPYEVLETPSISYQELQKSMVLSRILEYWYNDARWRTAFTLIFSKQKEMLLKLIDQLYPGDFLIQPMSFESKSMLLYQFCKTYYPDNLFTISLQWIRNGLSVKKEPANILTAWNSKTPQYENPLFNKNNYQIKYYYAIHNGLIYWFSFNNETSRNTPSQELVKTLI